MLAIVSAIWMEDSEGAWSLQTPVGYDDEQSLHDIVVKSPELLPLAGAPKITVLGREVSLPPSGYADVVAIEDDGRPVIIEVKLRNNAESRRAVIAQTLSYAAALHRAGRSELERVLLSRHLNGQSIFDRVRESLQDEELVQSDFEAGLEEHLAQGSFRAVIVLDEAPSELINLVGYLETVTTGLSLDLIAVHSYAIGGHRIVVPQRLDPEQPLDAAPPRAAATRPISRHDEPGAHAFRALIADSPAEFRETLTAMTDWADELAATVPGISLRTYNSPRGDSSLRPLITRDDVGLVTFWHSASGRPSASLWRSVFQRRAVAYIEPIERLLEEPIRQGRGTAKISPELLDLLGQAYRDAVHQSDPGV